MERFSTYWEIVKDKYLTWRTGKNKITRDWEKWWGETIVSRAETVENYYTNFKYIIELDPNKIWDMSEPIGWVTVQEFKEYSYPVKPLGENAIVKWFRGERNPWDSKFHLSELYGGDHVFAATNNEQDAIMISLKFGGNNHGLNKSLLNNLKILQEGTTLGLLTSR